MKIQKVKKRYILLLLVIFYISTSIFQFVRFRIKLNEKYGKVANKFQTTFFYNENMIINTMLSLGLIPIALLHGGIHGVEYVFKDFRLGIKDFIKPLPVHMTLKAPFMQESFQVTMRGGKIVSDTFYSTLTTDPKFQHLYSEWVKKQVGIEDENVELIFDGAIKDSSWVGEKPYIDFRSITSTDNLEEQICENTHNLYVKSNTYGDPGIIIKVKDYKGLQETLNYADKIEEKVESKVFIDYNQSMVNKGNDFFINVINCDESLILAIHYNNNKEYIDYQNNDNNWVKYE